VTYPTTATEAPHPESCPWCGRHGIHGVSPSPSGERHYRCVACDTTFFIHELPIHGASRSSLSQPPVKARGRFFSRFRLKR
jgi:transposase-like protein